MRAHLHTTIAVLAGLFLTACAHTDGRTASQPGAGALQDRDVYLSLVSAIADGGKPEAALAFLDEYLSQYPDDRRALLLKGDAYFKSGQMDSAGKVYQRLLAKGSSPAAEFGLGRVKAAQGNWPEAVSYLRRAYQHSPADPKILNDYGYALLEVSDAEQAYRLLGRAYELRPNDQIIRNNFMLAADRTGRKDRVDDIVQKLDNRDRAELKAFLSQWSVQTDGAKARKDPAPAANEGQ